MAAVSRNRAIVVKVDVRLENSPCHKVQSGFFAVPSHVTIVSATAAQNSSTVAPLPRLRLGL